MLVAEALLSRWPWLRSPGFNLVEGCCVSGSFGACTGGTVQIPMLQARVIKRGSECSDPQNQCRACLLWRYVQKREDLTQLHCRLEERSRVYTSRVGYGQFLLQLLHKPQKLENGAAPTLCFVGIPGLGDGKRTAPGPARGARGR